MDLDGGFGEHLERQMAAMKDRYPDRFVHQGRLDWTRVNDPDFGTQMAGVLEMSRHRGIQGLKISKAPGLYVKDAAGKIIAVDDARFDPVWAKCGELGIPVEIPVGDPVLQKVYRENAIRVIPGLQ